MSSSIPSPQQEHKTARWATLGGAILLTIALPIAIDQGYIRYNAYVLPLLGLVAVCLYIGFILFHPSVIQWIKLRKLLTTTIVLILIVGICILFRVVLLMSKKHVADLIRHDQQESPKKQELAALPNQNPTSLPVQIISPKNVVRKDAKDKLSLFVLEGEHTKGQFIIRLCAIGVTDKAIARTITDVFDWDHRVKLYLEHSSLGLAYLARFTNQVTPHWDYPCQLAKPLYYGAWNLLLSDLDKLNDFIEELTSNRNRTSSPTPTPLLITAEDVADKIAKKLADQRPAPTPIPKPPCRGDALNQCTDEDLLEWGKPLAKEITRYYGYWQDEFNKAAKIDDPRKTREAWAKADATLADRFRDCCAEETDKYYREVESRIGGGHSQNAFYEWKQQLAKPIDSKEWKAARSWPTPSDRIQEINYALYFAMLELKRIIEYRKIEEKYKSKP